MIVTCNNCGKKYWIDPQLMQKKNPAFLCKACNSIIKVDPLSPTSADNDIVAHSSPDPAAIYEEIPMPAAKPIDSDKSMDEVKSKPGALSRLRTVRIGLRIKMMTLFVAIPLIAFAIVGSFLLIRMNHLASVMTEEATLSATRSGEELVKTAARSVANQCRQHLLLNPQLTAENIMNDQNFQKIAIQRVGLTGYTALYAVDPMVLLAHPNQRLLGQPLTESVKDTLGKDIDRWLKIVGNIDRGENVESAGYYLWVDPDGILREKFMVLTPLEGTKYGVTATIYMEEFLRPIKKVQLQADLISASTRNYFITSLVGVLLLIAVIVSIYGHQLTRKIETLTEHAMKISVGELDANLNLRSKDELGSLADAIKLMQDSIRIAIERFRQKR
jgi:HAMP domain-containing protein